MTTESYLALRTEIDNIKEDIKEIKEDTKETNTYFRDTIEVLKENSIRQTGILENQEKQFQQQFSELNKDIVSLNEDVSGLRRDVNTNIETQTKWYQKFLDDNAGKTLKILFIIILILSGVKLVGIDINKIIGM